MHAGQNTVLTLLALSSLTLAPRAASQEVWPGTDLFFEKPNDADWTLPENQDRITDAVWLTRGNNRGIFNIAQEAMYTDPSPIDTEWASGSAVDWQSLTFTSWINWIQIPPTIGGVDAVVHLISDDIYIDIRFESWTLGPNGGEGGGGFSYWRGSGPQTPTQRASWGSIKSFTAPR